jgi:hypothetical protein
MAIVVDAAKEDICALCISTEELGASISQFSARFEEAAIPLSGALSAVPEHGDIMQSFSSNDR